MNNKHDTPTTEPETLIGVVQPAPVEAPDGNSLWKAVSKATSQGYNLRSVADDTFRVHRGSKPVTGRLDLFGVHAWLDAQ